MANICSSVSACLAASASAERECLRSAFLSYRFERNEYEFGGRPDTWPDPLVTVSEAPSATKCCANVHRPRFDIRRRNLQTILQFLQLVRELALCRSCPFSSPVRFFGSAEESSRSGVDDVLDTTTFQNIDKYHDFFPFRFYPLEHARHCVCAHRANASRIGNRQKDKQRGEEEEEGGTPSTLATSVVRVANAISNRTWTAAETSNRRGGKTMRNVNIGSKQSTHPREARFRLFFPPSSSSSVPGRDAAGALSP